MSVATASAVLRVLFTSTISRALPRAIAASAVAHPTFPVPMIPSFMVFLRSTVLTSGSRRYFTEPRVSTVHTRIAGPCANGATHQCLPSASIPEYENKDPARRCAQRWLRHIAAVGCLSGEAVLRVSFHGGYSRSGDRERATSPRLGRRSQSKAKD